MLLRHTVQFHWCNEGYESFEDFLGRMNHDKRKKIRQERRKLRAAGIECRRLTGEEAGESHWRFFFDCYRRTYRSHMSTPYLNLDFFLELARVIPRNLLLSIASRDNLEQRREARRNSTAEPPLYESLLARIDRQCRVPAPAP